MRREASYFRGQSAIECGLRCRHRIPSLRCHILWVYLIPASEMSVLKFPSYLRKNRKESKIMNFVFDIRAITRKHTVALECWVTKKTLVPQGHNTDATNVLYRSLILYIFPKRIWRKSISNERLKFSKLKKLLQSSSRTSITTRKLISRYKERCYPKAKTRAQRNSCYVTSLLRNRVLTPVMGPQRRYAKLKISLI